MDEDEVTAYKCNVCGKLYADEDEAISCHSDASPVDAWSCGRCGAVYEDRDEAHRCHSAV